MRKLLGIRRRSQMDKGERPTGSAVGIPWEVVTNVQEMTTRSGHYTALLETTGARGATKLHADEREQLLAVADALLFGDADSEQGLAQALDLITRLRESERWSAESCASTSTAADRSPLGPERSGGARPPSTGSGVPPRAQWIQYSHSVQNASSLTVGAMSLLDLACAGCAVAFTP